jgi:uncharacterized Tic20 family protein
MNTTPTATTAEDRVWAVLSHLSALSFGMGILLPIVGWSDQRRKSNYASFQCLQALGYQSVGFTVWALSYLVIIILGSVILLATLRPDGTGNANPVGLPSPGLIVFLILVFGLFALYLVLPIIAAIACALGKDFRYPILGDRLAPYLGYETPHKSEEAAWLDEDHEVRWVASMGHFSILIVLWGMLAPLSAWILQGRQHSFLKFQSVQTLIYQGATTIIYFIGGFMYLFGFVLLLVGMGATGGPDLNSSMGIISLVAFGVSLLISFMLILLVPLLHILGQWAGYRVLKGDNYRYPLVGRLAAKWISTNPIVEEKST